MNSSQYNIIAVDIGKFTLDVRSQGHHFEVPNQHHGFEKIQQLQDSEKPLLVVCEATGGYERKLIAFMHEHAVAVCCINPAQLRAFARSEGVKAKSDALDSKMILQFADQKQLRLLEQPWKVRQQIAALMDRRAQLKKLLSSEKNRIDKADEIALCSIEQVIDFIQKQIQTIETKIQELISTEPLLAELFDRLTQIKGVGPCTAWSVLAYLRELGTLKRTKIAALVGLAPYLKESGTFKGKRKNRRRQSKSQKRTLHGCSHSLHL